MAEDAREEIVGPIPTHCMSRKGARAPIGVKAKTAERLRATKSRLISFQPKGQKNIFCLIGLIGLICSIGSLWRPTASFISSIGLIGSIGSEDQAFNILKKLN